MAGAGAGKRCSVARSSDVLPGGSLRVRVYAGIDPVTRKRHYLRGGRPRRPERPRTKPRWQRLGSSARSTTGATRARSATLDQLLDRYLDQIEDAPGRTRSTSGTSEPHLRRCSGPEGRPHRRRDARLLLRRAAAVPRATARAGAPSTTATATEHECDERCRPHRCKPLSASYMRHIHFILSGAYKKAVRWRWVGMSPVEQADAASRADAQPAAADPRAGRPDRRRGMARSGLGHVVWLAMTTGARRGELCALRWSVDRPRAGAGDSRLRHAITRTEAGWTRDTKTHQQRRIALDAGDRRPPARAPRTCGPSGSPASGCRSTTEDTRSSNVG